MLDVNTIEPQRDRVVVRMLNLDEIYEDLVLQQESDAVDVQARYGEVVSKGPETDLPEHCPGLNQGDLVVFTQFAGHYLPTDDTESLYKIIRGYDIVTKGEMMEGKTVTSKEVFDLLEPTADRVMIEVVDLEKEEDGVILKGNKDPRARELVYGRVLKKAKGATAIPLRKGDLIAIDPFVGVVVQEYEGDEKPELRVLVDKDILLKVKSSNLKKK